MGEPGLTAPPATVAAQNVVQFIWCGLLLHYSIRISFLILFILLSAAAKGTEPRRRPQGMK